MFSLRKFILDGFKNTIGKMEDFQIILNATGWYEKNILLEEDLAELQALIEEKNKPIPEEISGIEEIQEENVEISNEENNNVESEQLDTEVNSTEQQEENTEESEEE